MPARGYECLHERIGNDALDIKWLTNHLEIAVKTSGYEYYLELAVRLRDGVIAAPYRLNLNCAQWERSSEIRFAQICDLPSKGPDR